MGRGLSPLQKHVLIMAQANRQQPDRFEFDLFAYEVLWELYNFKAHTHVKALRDQDGNRHIGGWKFSKNAIGHQRYNAAHAAVSKAFYRLQERGFVVCYVGYVGWSGLKLTDEGVRQAEALTAMPLPTLPND